MSDPRETLRDARARMKPLVARLLARRDEAQAVLDASIEERARLTQEVEAMQAGGRADLAQAVHEGLAELDARIQAEREAVALADQHFRESADDMKTLEKEEDDVDHKRVRAAIDAVNAVMDTPTPAPVDTEAKARAELAAMKAARAAGKSKKTL